MRIIDWKSRPFDLRKCTTYILLVVFLINVVFIPNDTFSLKKVSFVLLILLNLDAFSVLKSRDDLLMFSVGFLLPLYIIFKSILINGDIAGNIAGGFSGFLLLAYFIIKKYRFNLEELLMNILLLLAVFLVVSALLDFTGILPTYSNPALMWFWHSDNAMIGRGSRHAFGILYFMKASPMLLLCLAYCLREARYFSAMLTLFALFVSGTRANVLMALAVVAFCIIVRQKGFKNRLIILCAELIAAIPVLYFGNIIAYFVNIFSRKKGNDQIRNGHLDSIFTYWKEHPFNFFIGSGYSTQFYSSGISEYVSNVELSYWNLLRRVGLTVFLIMMASFLYPAVKLFKQERIVVVGYLAYLIVAYTNPLLYSSTGVTVLLYMYWLVNKGSEISDLNPAFKVVWNSWWS